MLIKAGHAPTQRPLSPSGAAPLSLATYLGQKSVAQMLLGDSSRKLKSVDSVQHHGTKTDDHVPTADISVLDAVGLPPLYIAVLTQNVQLLRLLLEHGADPNFALPFTEEEAAVVSSTSSSHSGSRPTTSESSSERADGGENYVPNKSTVPLEVAAMLGFVEGLTTLRNFGAWVNTTDEFGDTPAMHAVRNRDFEVLSVLLDGSGLYPRRNSEGLSIYMICDSDSGGHSLKSAVSLGLTERVNRKHVVRLKKRLLKLLAPYKLELPVAHQTTLDAASLPLEPGILAARVSCKDAYEALKSLAEAESLDDNFADFIMTLLVNIADLQDESSSTAGKLRESEAENQTGGASDGTDSRSDSALVTHILALLDFFGRTQSGYFDIDSLLFHNVSSRDVVACYGDIAKRMTQAATEKLQHELRTAEDGYAMAETILAEARKKMRQAEDAFQKSNFGRERKKARELKSHATEVVSAAELGIQEAKQKVAAARSLIERLDQRGQSGAQRHAVPSADAAQPHLQIDAVAQMLGLFKTLFPTSYRSKVSKRRNKQSEAAKQLSRSFALASHRVIETNRVLHLLKRSPLEVQLDKADARLQKEAANLRLEIEKTLKPHKSDDSHHKMNFSEEQLEAADAPAIEVQRVLVESTLECLVETTDTLREALSSWSKRWNLRRGAGPRSSSETEGENTTAQTRTATLSRISEALDEDEAEAVAVAAARAARAERRNDKLTYAAQCNDPRAFSEILHHDLTLTKKFQFAATHVADDSSGKHSLAHHDSAVSVDSGGQADDDHLLTLAVGLNAPDEDDDVALSKLRGQIGDSYQYNINAISYDGFTPLTIAVMHGNLAMVQICLQCGADVDQDAPELECTPLIAAILLGHEDIVHELLKCGPNPFRTLPNGLAPIHAAVLSGKVSIVQALIHSNNNLANLRLRATHACTPLHVAAFVGNLEIVNLLLDSVPPHKVQQQVLTTDVLDRDALFVAVQNFHLDVVKELLSRKADPNKSSAYGHHFATTPLGVAVFHARPGIVEALLEHGALPDGAPGVRLGQLRHTPAMLAAFMGDFDILCRLVRAGMLGFSRLVFASAPLKVLSFSLRRSFNQNHFPVVAGVPNCSAGFCSEGRGPLSYCQHPYKRGNRRRATHSKVVSRSTTSDLGQKRESCSENSARCEPQVAGETPIVGSQCCEDPVACSGLDSKAPTGGEI